MSAATTETLIDRAKAGDHHAFEELVLRYNFRLRCFFRGYGVQEADCDNLAQDTWVMVFMALPSFEYRTEVQFVSWLMEIAKNRLNKYWRDLGRPELLTDFTAPDSPDPPVETPNPMDTMIDQEERSMLLTAVNTMRCEDARGKVYADILGCFSRGEKPSDIAAQLRPSAAEVSNTILPGINKAIDGLKRNEHIPVPHGAASVKLLKQLLGNLSTNDIELMLQPSVEQVYEWKRLAMERLGELVKELDPSIKEAVSELE